MGRTSVPTRVPVAAAVTAALVFVAAGVLWLWFGVTLLAAAGFLGYTMAFSFLPGVAAWMAVTGRRALTVSDLALGWALGYALELIAFVVTAAAELRWAFAFYPLVVVGISIAAVWVGRRRRGVTSGRARSGVSDAEREGGRDGIGWMWALSGLLIVLLVYLAEGYFTMTPLPWDLSGPVSYAPDYVWSVSVAAEARNHWPIEIPNVAGERLEYHWFAFAHIAAVNQVTGIELTTVAFRLFPVPILALVALLFVAIARELSLSAWVGVVAAALALMVGPFVPWPDPPSEFFTHIYESPSFGYGLVPFLALVAILASHLERGGRRGRVLPLVVVFAVAASGAKSSILPTLIGALVLLGIALVIRDRRRPWRERRMAMDAALALVTLAVAFVAARVVLYPNASGELELKVFADSRQLYPLKLLSDGKVNLPWLLDQAAIAVLSVPQYLKLLLPLLPGLWLALRRPEWRRRFGAWWMLALLTSSLLVFSIAWQRSGSHAYFLYYGYMAAAGLSAAGLVSLWRRRFHDVRVGPFAGAALAAVVLAPWAVDGPLGFRAEQPAPAALYRDLAGEVTWPVDNANLTPELYHGYVWLSRNTPKAAVLASNNRWIDPSQTDARYFYPSAFAARRGLFEGMYGLTSGAYDVATQAEVQRSPGAGTYGERAAAIQAMFVEGDRRAARDAKEKWGVTHLVVDRVHPGLARPERVAALGRVVYDTPAMLVVEIR